MILDMITDVVPNNVFTWVLFSWVFLSVFGIGAAFLLPFRIGPKEIIRRIRRRTAPSITAAEDAGRIPAKRPLYIALLLVMIDTIVTGYMAGYNRMTWDMTEWDGISVLLFNMGAWLSFGVVLYFIILRWTVEEENRQKGRTAPPESENDVGT
jgi:hypothetical protein